jgi:hypothetical protein
LFRLPQVTVQVWEYTGEVRNAVAEKIITALESQLASVQLPPETITQLTNLQTQIENLMALFNDLSVPSEQTANFTTESKVEVSSATATLVVDTNEARRGLVIRNNTGTTVYIGLSNSVSPVDFFVRLAGNVAYQLDISYTGEIWAITKSGQTELVTTEFERRDSVMTFDPPSDPAN